MDGSRSRPAVITTTTTSATGKRRSPLSQSELSCTYRVTHCCPSFLLGWGVGGVGWWTWRTYCCLVWRGPCPLTCVGPTQVRSTHLRAPDKTCSNNMREIMRACCFPNPSMCRGGLIDSIQVLCLVCVPGSPSSGTAEAPFPEELKDYHPLTPLRFQSSDGTQVCTGMKGGMDGNSRSRLGSTGRHCSNG